MKLALPSEAAWYGLVLYGVVLYGLFALFLTATSDAATTTQPPIQITGAWVRESIPGQTSTSAYMKISTQQAFSLRCAETKVAESVALHRMTLQQGIMKMRMVEDLKMKANVPVELKPNGLHLMLFDLKKPVKAGELVPMTLHFFDEKNQLTELTIHATVK